MENAKVGLQLLILDAFFNVPKTNKSGLLGFFIYFCIFHPFCLHIPETETVKPQIPASPEVCGECQEEERRRSQDLECPGCSECCGWQEMEMEEICQCEQTLQPGQPSVKKTQIKRVSNIEKKIKKNNSLRK